jgi:hypothetical protein
MRRLVLAAALLAAVFGLARETSPQERGKANGVVLEVAAQVQEDGPVILVVTIKGEGVWEARFEVGPNNPEAYATVGGLRKGDKVTVAWVREEDRNLIREIRVDAREENERRERGEGERPEREKVTEREPAHPEPARGAEEERERSRLKEKREAEERVRAEKRERETREREVVREEGTPREEERRELERRERDRQGVQRRQMKATVVSVATGEAGEGEGPRILKVAPLEEGEGMTFTVGADRRKLYETVGELKPGEKVIVIWVTEAGRPWLVEIGKAD